MDQEPPALISEATVLDHLVERSVLPEPAGEVTALGGGVSGIVLAVDTGAERLVVKQPLDDFAVADTWLVKRERLFVETAALRLAAETMPGAVPNVLDLDEERFVLVMRGAPAGWRPWKADLLDGHADPNIAARLGSLLRTWHEGVSGRTEGFDDAEIFGQQRVDPYYRTTMQRRPDIAADIQRLLDRMLATRTTLVHGDWSPKNVLVGSDGLWVIDWEITHAGDPAFDLAFMTNHLLLKAVHRPASTDGFRACCAAFWDAYGAEPDAYVLGHVGALMSARVDGRSPVEYLSGSGFDTARALGARLLRGATLEEAWLHVGR